MELVSGRELALAAGVIAGIALLVLPVRFYFRLSAPDEFQGRFLFDLRFILGLLTFRYEVGSDDSRKHFFLFKIPLLSRSVAKKESPRRAKSKKKQTFGARIKSLGRLAQYSFRDRHQIYVLIKRLFRCGLQKVWSGHVVFGFENPATTGEILGLFWALGGNRRGFSVEPNFMEKTLRGDIELRFYALPIMVLGVLLTGAWSLGWKWRRVF